jgi:hypothetical protein
VGDKYTLLCKMIELMSAAAAAILEIPISFRFQSISRDFFKKK